MKTKSILTSACTATLLFFNCHNNPKEIIRTLIFNAGYQFRPIETNDTQIYQELFPNESIIHRRFYNISAGGHLGFGCGIHHPLWTNIDRDRPWQNGYIYNPKTDIAHDLLEMKPIPIESSSAELVHSRFTIEHIHDSAAAYFFREVYRIMKNGAVFRIVTPNIELDLNALQQSDLHFYFWIDHNPDISVEQCFLYHCFTQTSQYYKREGATLVCDQELRDLFSQNSYIDALNILASKCSLTIHKKYLGPQGDHINWWTAEKLTRMLKEAGFTKIHQSACGQSISPVLRNDAYFDDYYNRVMMYFDVVK